MFKLIEVGRVVRKALFQTNFCLHQFTREGRVDPIWTFVKNFLIVSLNSLLTRGIRIAITGQTL